MCFGCVGRFSEVLGGERVEKGVVWAITRSLSVFLGDRGLRGAPLSAMGSIRAFCTSFCRSHSLGFVRMEFGRGGV